MTPLSKPLATTVTSEQKSLKNLVAEKAGSLHPQDTVATAGERMREQDAEQWPVTEDRKLVGMVKEKNPDWKIGGHGHDPQAFQVGEIMHTDVVFCHEDEDCGIALRLMEDHGLTILPVVDKTMKVVGMLSLDEVRDHSSRDSDRAPTMSEVERRAAELAQKDGRAAFTETDLQQARIEVLGPRDTPANEG